MRSIVLVEQAGEVPLLSAALSALDPAWVCTAVSAADAPRTLGPNSDQLLILSHRPPALDALAVWDTLGAPTAVPTILLADPGAETAVADALQAGIHAYLIRDPDNRYLTLLPHAIQQAERLCQARVPLIPTSHTLIPPELQPGLLRDVLRTAIEGIVVIDAAARIVYINPGAEAMFQHPAENLLGRSLSELMPVRFHARHELHVAQFAASQERAREMQARDIIHARRSDGTEFQIEASIVKIGAQDELLMAAILRDVSAQQRTQASLNQYAHRLQALHQMDQAILTAHTPRDVAQAALAHLRQLIPYRLASIVTFEEDSADLTVLAVATQSSTTEPDIVFHDPQEDSRWREIITRTVTNPQQDINVLEAILPEAGVHSYMIMPLMAQNKMRGVLSLGADSDDLFGRENMRMIQEVARPVAVAIQQALLLDTERTQRALAETLQEVAAVLNSTLDRERVLQTILEQLARVVNYDSASVMLVDEDELAVVARRDVGVERPYSRLQFAALPHVRDVLEKAEPVIIANTATDDRWHLAPGTTYIRCWLGVPLTVKRVVIGVLNLNKETADSYTQQDARIAAAFADHAAVAVENAQLYTRAVQEIHDRKQAEAALQAERALLAQRVDERTVELSAANAQLARALRARDEFLANMTHELRTPLNAILGLTDVLQAGMHGDLTSKQQDLLDTISASGTRLLDLINDILDVAHIEAGRLKLNPYPMSITTVCQSSVQLIGNLLQERQIQPPVVDVKLQTDVIWADELRVQQILVNLLNNAIKFTPPGGQIGLTVRQDAAQEATLFTVWDTGIGIKLDDLRRLFGGADGPQPFVQLDSGLDRRYEGTGLGLSLIYRLTEMHGGSVTVQSAIGEGSRFAIALPNKQQVPTDAPRKPSLHGPIVLVADDDEQQLRRVAAQLAAAGYRLVLAHNGREAVRQARAVPPDLIIIDLQMRELGGLEGLRLIRDEVGLLDVPAIATTSLLLPGDRAACRDAGVTRLMLKPVPLSMLQTAVTNLIGTR